MKKMPLFLTLSAFVFSALSSSAAGPNTPLKAKIDGADFELKNGSKYVALLNEENKTAVVTFYGNDVKDKDGKSHPQKINVAYVLNPGGQPVIKGVVFEFNEQKFWSLPDAAMNVSKLEWSKDKKSFLLSANFDCKVQKNQTSANYEGIIGIQGSIENVQVTVAQSDVAVVEE